MMEEQSSTSFIYNNASSTTIGNNGVSYNFNTFENLDPFVEKIRSLFVPSLEPRIHHCLETFVYHRDGRSKNPRLKRFLETAAAWQKPIEAFCAKMSDEEFSENIVGRAIEFFIKGGLVDFFLDSIILNNRLNKVCQDLDELGIERDLLRYLTVWNYINEKDYWIDSDPTVSMSMSHESYETINRTSDLDVEIGSKLRDNRDKKMLKKSLKRRATDDSSVELENDKNSANNSSKNDRALPQYQTWLSLDSSDRKKSNVEKRKKSILQTIPCRSSNCPIYRLKCSRRNNCEGKLLKLKIFEASTTNSKLETPRFVKLSKLRLPCEFNDLMSKFMSTTLPEIFSISRRKKFEANIINVCRRINEILRNVDKNGVKRCKLHCEIFPSHLTFRMIKRESDGCKISLLTEIISFNKIESKSRSDSRGSSITQLRNVTENSRESCLTIYESARFDPGEGAPQTIPSSPAKCEIKQNLSDSNFKSKNSFSPKQWNKNDVEDSTCNCYTLVHDNLDLETRNDFQIEKNESNPREPTRGEFLRSNHGDISPNEECTCNETYNQKSNIDNKSITNGKINDIYEKKPEQNSIERLSGDEPLFHSTAIDFESPVCLCNDSFDEKSFDHRRASNFAELVAKKSFMRLIDDKTIDSTCHCEASFENLPSKLEPEIIIGTDQENGAERLDKSVENIVVYDRQKSNESYDINVKHEDERIESLRSLLKRNSAIDHTVNDTRSNSINVKSVRNSSEENRMSISRSKIACECPSDCTCTNKNLLDDDSVDNHSQCSRDTRDVVETIEKHSIRVSRATNRSNEMETRKNENCIENQTNEESKRLNVRKNGSEKSLISLKPVKTKVLSRPFEEKAMKTSELYCPDWTSGQILENNKTRGSSSEKNSPVISTRLPRSKGRKINISIELCSESDGSMEKMINDCSTIVPASKNYTEKVENFHHSQSRPWRHSFDRNPDDSRANQFPEKNTNDECLSGANRMYSPLRPLESRDCLSSLGWDAASMRNSNVHGKPMKSDLRSNAKFTGQSMNRTRKTFREYESGKFKRSHDDNERCKENNERHISLHRNNKPSKSPLNSERLSNSFINGHLCHAFSASSVDKMRHLIKRKLRRILLERDKSTNTPKTTLTNERYRVSVPNGKIERFTFPKKYCRTIWESHSASDSIRSSRSFATDDHSGIRDRENILHLLYKSTKQSHSQDSDYSKSEINSIDSSRNFRSKRQNEICECDEMKSCTRLAGGSDFVPRKKKLGSEDYLSSNEQRQLSLKNGNQCSYSAEDNKLWGTSVNCKFHKIFQNESTPNDNFERKILGKVYQEEFVDCHGKLDLSGNSTSRHIYLHEFPQYESSSNDQSLGSRYWKTINSRSSKKMYSSDISNAHARDKNLRVEKKVCGKNMGNVYSNRMKFSSNNNNNNVCSGIKGIKNSLSNINTMNSRQKGFNYLDYDLRSKLSQYVTLCKNVKYSLLKRLRPTDVYDVERTSMPSRDRYKITES